ncbi:hypothetical protein HDV57DRAFT_521115 [Trichoderma longibrachiatum]
MLGLLGSVLRQFQRENDIHPEILKDYWAYKRRDKYNSKVQRPSLTEVKELLSECTRGKRVFIVVDAMYEFSYNNREPLIEQSPGAPNTDTNIMVTSRELDHLYRLKRRLETDEIEAHDEDIDEYILKLHRELPQPWTPERV